MTKSFFKIIALFFSFLHASTVFALTYSTAVTSVSDFFSSVSEDENAGSTTFLSLNIPFGGRAESLGSAYTGLSDDISFFDYNAAASSMLDETEIAVFHNAWISDSALETLAATTRFGDFGMGAAIKCFYVPFTEYDYFGNKQTGGYSVCGGGDGGFWRTDAVFVSEIFSVARTELLRWFEHKKCWCGVDWL